MCYNMLMSHIINRHTLATLPVLLTALTATAASSEAELAKEAQSSGTFESLVSTENDPVGEAGLWGFRARVVVPHTCQESFDALKDVEHYPKHMDKVKRVVVLKRTADTLLTDYTEGAMGIESRTTMQWTFQSTPPMRITSENVGEGDAKTWMQTDFVDVGHPTYCALKIRLFADTSFIPTIMMTWLTKTVVNETASEYRRLIARSVAERKAATP